MHTVSCLTGFFQADSVIADHTLLEHCDIVFGNDADFSFLAGRNCLQVHEFKYSWKTDELSNFTLKTGFLSTIMPALLFELVDEEKSAAGAYCCLSSH